MQVSTILIIILIVIVLGLVIYNIVLYQKLKMLDIMEKKLKGTNIVKDFMSVIGERTPINEKLEKINELILERFDIKYSTIVVFDGAEYVIKASNVEERLWDTMKSLHNEEIFKDSVESYIPKYITVNNETERLPYQKSELIRAKSAMFFPLYIDNVYIGYWIIESRSTSCF